jgi:hypothetical protein
VVPVVFNVNVLILAIAVGESPFRSWPSNAAGVWEPGRGLPGRGQ